MKQMSLLLFSFLFIYFSATRPRYIKNQTFCQSATTVHLFSLSLTVGNFHCAINRMKNTIFDIKCVTLRVSKIN